MISLLPDVSILIHVICFGVYVYSSWSVETLFRG